MIDIENERLIRLGDVPDLPWLPKRGSATLGRSTVFRWASTGINGVILETVQAGGSKCTSESALMRFFERLKQPGATSNTTTPSEQKRAEQRACDILEREGI